MCRPTDRRTSAPTTRTDLRISDRDRDHAASLLRDHAAAGRLTVDELSARIEATLAARTQAELDRQFVDLPQARSREHEALGRAKRRGMRVHAAAYVAVSIGMIVIWAATGAHYFWPVWPMMGWGIGLLSHITRGRYSSRVSTTS